MTISNAARRLTLAAALAVPLTALGSTIIGNPLSKVVVVDGTDVYIYSLDLHGCSSDSTSVLVDETLSATEEATVTLPTGDYCAVDVNVRWDIADPIEAVEVTGFDELEVTSGGASVQIEVDAGTETAELL